MSIINHMSVIELGASIGKGTSVGEYCHIGSDVTIGKNNTIEAHTVITGNTTIGNNNHISSYTVLGSAPQDIKIASSEVSLIIGNDNTIGPYSLINTGTDHGGKVTTVGNNNQLMEKIHIGHDVQMGDNCLMERDSALGGHVIVGDNVSFMESSAVHQFVKIGDMAYIDKGAALTQDIPPYCLARGNRAKVSGVNVIALKKSLSDMEVDTISDAYNSLFASNQSPKEIAVNALKKNQSVILRKLYQFIVESQRGIPFVRKTNVN